MRMILLEMSMDKRHHKPRVIVEGPLKPLQQDQAQLVLLGMGLLLHFFTVRPPYVYTWNAEKN